MHIWTCGGSREENNLSIVLKDRESSSLMLNYNSIIVLWNLSCALPPLPHLSVSLAIPAVRLRTVLAASRQAGTEGCMTFTTTWHSYLIFTCLPLQQLVGFNKLVVEEAEIERS